MASEELAATIVSKKLFKQIGDYTVGGTIGHGASSKVKEGIDTRNLRRVAVKVINFKYLKKQKHQVELKREIAILKRLQNLKYVIGFIEMIWKRDEDKHKLYIVLQLASYGSLETLIKHSPERRLAIADSQCFFWQLTEALSECHSRGIIHRDVKPANILLTSDGVVKLSDFGVAEEMNMYKAAVCVKNHGSPAFQPPEVLGGEEHEGPLSDTWAAAITLCYMVSGETPFHGHSLPELIRNIREAEFVPPPQAIGTEFEDLLRLTLVKAPHERYSLDMIRKHAWVQRGSAVTLTVLPLQPPYKSLFLDDAWMDFIDTADAPTAKDGPTYQVVNPKSEAVLEAHAAEQKCAVM